MLADILVHMAFQHNWDHSRLRSPLVPRHAARQHMPSPPHAIGRSINSARRIAVGLAIANRSRPIQLIFCLRPCAPIALARPAKTRLTRPIVEIALIRCVRST